MNDHCALHLTGETADTVTALAASSSILLISQLLSQPLLISSKKQHYQEPRLKEQANLIMIVGLLSAEWPMKQPAKTRSRKSAFSAAVSLCLCRGLWEPKETSGKYIKK